MTRPGLGKPVGRHLPLAALQREKTHARIVGQAQHDAASAGIAAAGIDLPEQVPGKARRIDDLALCVIAQPLPSRAPHEHADQVRLARFIFPLLPRRIFALELTHIGDRRIDACGHRIAEQAHHVAGRIGIVLIPRHAGRHRQELLDGNAVITAALQLGDVARHGIGQRTDLAVRDRRAHQCGRKALGDRKACPAIVRRHAKAVALQPHLAVLDHHQPGDILVFHEGIDRGLVERQRRAPGQCPGR